MEGSHFDVKMVFNTSQRDFLYYLLGAPSIDRILRTFGDYDYVSRYIQEVEQNLNGIITEENKCSYLIREWKDIDLRIRMLEKRSQENDQGQMQSRDIGVAIQTGISAGAHVFNILLKFMPIVQSNVQLQNLLAGFTPQVQKDYDEIKKTQLRIRGENASTIKEEILLRDIWRDPKQYDTIMGKLTEENPTRELPFLLKEDGNYKWVAGTESLFIGAFVKKSRPYWKSAKKLTAKNLMKIVNYTFQLEIKDVNIFRAEYPFDSKYTDPFENIFP